MTLSPSSTQSCFSKPGAKAADASRRVGEVLPEGSIVAFEANPYTLKRFNKEHDYLSLGVDYRNQALSSAEGTLAFNVRKTEDGRPMADGQGSLLKHISYEPGHIEVEVPATTIDEVHREFGRGRCAMWIDVEGATFRRRSNGMCSA